MPDRCNADSDAFVASPLDSIAIDTLRFLAVDMVERANSGHPGAPMGQAAAAYLLWRHFLRFDPSAPQWMNRDRFVLSCGHASALLYGLLHLAGYDLSIEELQNFRQLGSKTPGHPEYGHTAGVETTTGPLGQGLATAVGMALAERLLAERFNTAEHAIFDNRTWVLASDGDIQEGIASEASSLAGHLELGKLNVIYDANQITIDGPLSMSMSEDVCARYQAYGWHTTEVEDGNDLEALHRAYAAACSETERPSLIKVRTIIGYGSPNKADSSKSHGAPLGTEEVELTKTRLGWPTEPPFRVPTESREAFRKAAERGRQAHNEWQAHKEQWAAAEPERAAELERRAAGTLPEKWHEALPEVAAGEKLASRKSSGAVLAALEEPLPELIGGSADLTGSNNTYLPGSGDYKAGQPARNFRWGIREHAMGAAMNGMALSGLIRPFGGTFLIFADYLRPALRLSALMGVPVTWVFTHDSIFLGEDGPTHQPIAALAALRAIPNLVVLRPADATETAGAWKVALERTSGPTAIALTRQGLPTLSAPAAEVHAGVARGAWIAHEPESEPTGILLATGSEVALAISTAQQLATEGEAVRVVSMPSWELFEDQDQAYRDQVLPPQLTRRLAIEAACPLGWDRYTGPTGAIQAIDGFGASAPASDLAESYGFTPEAVKETWSKLS